jgi:hypothetical protein
MRERILSFGEGWRDTTISYARVFLDIQVKTFLYFHLKKGDLIRCTAPDVVYLARGVRERRGRLEGFATYHGVNSQIDLRHPALRTWRCFDPMHSAHALFCAANVR